MAKVRFTSAQKMYASIFTYICNAVNIKASQWVRNCTRVKTTREKLIKPYLQVCTIRAQMCEKVQNQR